MSKITKELHKYLNEIAGRLSRGRACVMVGAGFSKNSDPVKKTDKRFLNWNELGDLFYERIYDKVPDENTGHYLDAMKLAEIVEASFGRPALDQILLDNLPDEEFAPSGLHKKLLELNWSDVFTTNYDTLLERARKFVAGRRYQLVLSKEDLIYSSSPRIVKLHGSFPSTRPFVISHEDYRRYPIESAAFINTVQQALLENVMCLIGFSGDDPNFQNWIGWIHDNLGKNYSSKIYLVTADNSSMETTAFFTDKNIVVLNMAECFQSTENATYADALELFLNELSVRQEKHTRKEWMPHTGQKYEQIKRDLDWNLINKTEIDMMNGIIRFWNTSKQNYPGWIIMPSKDRKFYHLDLDSFERYLDFYNEYIWNGDNSARRMFLELYDWVRRVCLLPLTDHMFTCYQDVLDADGTKDSRSFDLHLAVLSYYRQNCKFQDHQNLLQSIEQNMKVTTEQEKQLYCEKAYAALYQFDFIALENILNEWPADNVNYDMELVHAGLMWECGQYTLGIRRLGNTLEGIRCSEGPTEDIDILSQEAYIMNLLRIILNNYQMESMTADNAYYKYIFTQEYGQKNRFSFLKSYDCDPGSELDYFKNTLKYENVPKQEEDLYDTICMQFILFLERTGLPMLIQSNCEYYKPLRHAIRRIGRRNLFWGIALSLRTHEITTINAVITQTSVAAAKTDQLDPIAQKIISLIDRDYFKELNDKTNQLSDEKPYKYTITITFLPLILSKLISYTSDNIRGQTYHLIKQLLKQTYEKESVCVLAKGFFCSLDAGYLKHHTYQILDLMIETDDEIPVLLSYCDFAFYGSEGYCFPYHHAFWKKLKYQLRNSHVKAIYRMSLMYYARILNPEEAKELKEIVMKDLSEKKTYPLEVYYFLQDLLQEDSNEIISLIIADQYLDFLSDMIKLTNTDCYRSYKLFHLILHTYPLSLTDHIISTALHTFISLIQRQEITKFAYCYQIFIEVLLQSDMKLSDCTKHKRNNPDFCLLMIANNFQNASLLQEAILQNLSSSDAVKFIESASLFYYSLSTDYDSWKIYLEQILFGMTTIIKNTLPYAWFCIEIIRKIIRLSAEIGYSFNYDRIKDLLTFIIGLPDTSELFLKIYGAKLAFDLSQLPETTGIRKILKKWEALCNNTKTHALIRKQWGDLT